VGKFVAECGFLGLGVGGEEFCLAGGHGFLFEAAGEVVVGRVLREGVFEGGGGGREGLGVVLEAD
jgi:hypothetical protein